MRFSIQLRLACSRLLGCRDGKKIRKKNVKISRSLPSPHEFFVLVFLIHFQAKLRCEIKRQLVNVNMTAANNKLYNGLSHKVLTLQIYLLILKPSTHSTSSCTVITEL